MWLIMLCFPMLRYNYTFLGADEMLYEKHLILGYKSGRHGRKALKRL